MIDPREEISKPIYDRIAWHFLMLYMLELNYVNNTDYSFDTYQVKELDNPFSSNECFHLLSLPRQYVSGYSKYPEFVEYIILSLRGDTILQMEANIFSKQALRSFNFLDPQHTHHPRGFRYSNHNQTAIQLQHSIENELIDCGKSVFIAKSGVVEAEFQFLERHYPTRKFYKGKDILEKISFGWQFTDRGISKLPKYFKAAIETGIYGRLRKEEIYQKSLHRTPVMKLKTEMATPFGLDGAISTLFILCGVVLFVASFTFMTETFFQSYVSKGSLICSLVNRMIKTFLK